MKMMTTCRSRSMTSPAVRHHDTPSRRQSGRSNVVAHSKNLARTRRIDSADRCAANNNSMSKAIKSAPTAATGLAAMTTTTTTQSARVSSLTRTRILPSAADYKQKILDELPKTTTWDEMLSARSKTSSRASDVSPPTCNFNTSALQQFDPVRTLAFLIAELNSKLKTTLPVDKTIQRILHEIRIAFKRIENTSPAPRSANVTSDANLMQQNRVNCCNSSAQTDDKYCVRYYEKAAQTEQGTKFKSYFRGNSTQLRRNEEVSPPASPCKKSCSNLTTPRRTDSSRRNESESPKRRRLVDEIVPLDGKTKCNCGGCTECTSNNDGGTDAKDVSVDNLNIRDELSKCTEEIATLKAEVACLQDRLEAANVREACLIRELENRCKLLQNELETLQDIVQKQTNELSIVQQLSAKLKESAMKINLLEKSKLEADRILVFTRLEKEKLAMLKTIQENQVATLHSEINDLTSAVRKQIEDIHYASSNISNKRDHNILMSRKSEKKSKADRYQLDEHTYDSGSQSDEKTLPESSVPCARILPMQTEKNHHSKNECTHRLVPVHSTNMAPETEHDCTCDHKLASYGPTPVGVTKVELKQNTNKYETPLNVDVMSERNTLSSVKQDPTLLSKHANKNMKFNVIHDLSTINKRPCIANPEKPKAIKPKHHFAAKSPEKDNKRKRSTSFADTTNGINDKTSQEYRWRGAPEISEIVDEQCCCLRHGASTCAIQGEDGQIYHRRKPPPPPPLSSSPQPPLYHSAISPKLAQSPAPLCPKPLQHPCRHRSRNQPELY